MTNNKIILDLKDPDGWTLENNTHPNLFVSNPLDESDWRNWFEWDDDGIHPIVCHNCIKRAKHGSGNCVNGGDYFLCVKNGSRVKKQKKLNIKKTVQSKLVE